MRRVFALFLLIAVMGTACGDDDATTTTGPAVTAGSTTTAGTTTTTLPSADPLAAYGQEVLRGLRHTQSVSFPAHFEDFDNEPVRTGDEFDVNEYFSVVDRLAMEEGYTLDYVYSLDGIGGYPMLYARPADQERYGTRSEYEESHDPNDDYRDHIVVDDTAEGYLQLALLDIVAAQFYLWWHAEYNDTSPIFTRESLDATLDEAAGEMEAAQMTIARRVEPAPTVTLGDETAEVRLYTWTKWGGLSLRTYRFSRAFPHQFVERLSEQVAEYDCGWVF